MPRLTQKLTRLLPLVAAIPAALHYQAVVATEKKQQRATDAPPLPKDDGRHKPLLLNSAFREGNLIREVGENAAAVEARSGKPVLKFHLGNPATEQDPEVKLQTILSVLAWPGGYAPHAGTPESRQIIADQINLIEGAGANHFTAGDVALSPGATAITNALISAVMDKPGQGILISMPGYNTYRQQTKSAKGKVIDYGLNAQGLIDEEATILAIKAFESAYPGNNAMLMIGKVIAYALKARGQIDEAKQVNEAFERAYSGSKAKLMIVNYPHNPTGKTLSKDEARQTAETLNNLAERFPQLVFYNDAVYAATVAPEIGYNSFYPFLNEETKRRTVTGLSGAKSTSQAAERVGAFASVGQELMQTLRNASSIQTAGTNVHAEAGFAAGLLNHNEIFRRTGEYYELRRAKVAAAIEAANAEAGRKVIKAENSKGSMYVFADFNPLHGAEIPPELQKEAGTETLQTSEQLMNVLMNLNLVDLPSVSLAPGTAFGQSAENLSARISCVANDPKDFDQFEKAIVGAVKLLSPAKSAEKGEPGQDKATFAARLKNSEASAERSL